MLTCYSGGPPGIGPGPLPPGVTLKFPWPQITYVGCYSPLAIHY